MNEHFLYFPICGRRVDLYMETNTMKQEYMNEIERLKAQLEDKKNDELNSRSLENDEIKSQKLFD